MIEHFRDLAAAERTYLAWVRTAVASVAFGVAIAQFADIGDGLLVSTGTLILIGLGALLLVFSTLHYFVVRRRILAREDEPEVGKGAGLIPLLMMIILISLVLVFMARLALPGL